MNTTPHPSAALFLRDDGSLLLARGEQTVEVQMTPAQLLKLGVDCLRVAVELQPACLPEALAAMEATTVQVPVDTAEAAPCLLN